MAWAFGGSFLGLAADEDGGFFEGVRQSAHDFEGLPWR